MPKRGINIHKRKDGRWEARYQKGRRPDGKLVYGPYTVLLIKKQKKN